MILHNIPSYAPDFNLCNTCTTGLEKLTNANRSVCSVSDRLFPVELTEIADWKSMSEYMLHSNFGKALTRGYRREFWCIYLYIAASLFTKYLSIFLDVLSAERILNIKILRNFRE